LATTFVRDGWSLKQLQRRIVLSATYRQQSAERPDLVGADPENRLLGRMNRRRLDFESTRDALLAVAGHLERRVGGPSVKDLLAPTSTRRTLYGFVDRLQVPGLHRSFDFPSPDATSARRDETTIPQQALYFMNSPFAAECARAAARRTDDQPSRRIETLFALLFQREPTARERSMAMTFLGPAAPADWERLAHALLATNEFVFVD